MANSEKIYSCRLINEEIEYINNFWDGKFSYFVKTKINDDIKTNNKQNKVKSFNNFSSYIVITALGIIFFLFGIEHNTGYENVLYFIPGLFLVIMGVVGGMLIALQSTRRN